MRNLPPNLGRWVTVVFLVLASIYLLYYHALPALWEVLTTIVPWCLPFIVAWFLAALLDPLVVWLVEKARWPRTVASLVAVLVLVVVVAVVVVGLVSQLVVELTSLAVDLPRYGSILKENLDYLNRFYRSWQLLPQAMAPTEEGINTITLYIREFLTRVVQQLLQAMSGIPRFFIALVVTLVATFFFSRDKLIIKRGLVNLFPGLAHPHLAGVSEELGAGLVGYIKAQGMLVTLTALQVLAGLYMLRVDYALSLSVLIALLDILPVVGPGTVFLPWAGWEFMTGRFGVGVALVVLYAAITLVRQILEPKVIGKNLGLHPLAALTSIYVGIQAMGLVGAILGPFAALLLKAAYRAGFFHTFLARGKNC